jgi:hypothetical protein
MKNRPLSETEHKTRKCKGNNKFPYFPLPLFLTILAFCICLKGNAERIRLYSHQIESLEINENLVQNFSFEYLQPGTNLPSGWIWDKRNTNALCNLDDKFAHSGKYSIKIANTTPYGANLYGTLYTSQPIHLESGKSYVLSAYVLSSQPGVAWIGGGGDWHLLSIPPTGGKWARVWATFTASEEDLEFVLRINTDSPTPGFWIDDVKLEEGKEPTPCIFKIDKFLVEPIWREEEEISGDGDFTLPFYLYSPRDILTEASLKWGKTPSYKAKMQIPKGISKLVFKCEAFGITGKQHLNLRFVEGGKIMMNSDFVVNFVSSSSANARLEKIAESLPDVKKILEELRGRGEDISYPMVTYTVLVNFVQYTKEDLDYYKDKKEIWILRRALFAIEDMEKMLNRLKNELKKAKAGKLHFPKVPRWTGEERPIIEGPSFIAPAKTPNSPSRMRPVFFNGYGAFDQVKADIEKFPNYGVNIIQIEFGPVDIFPKEDEVSDSAIKEMLTILDRAKKVGVAVNLLISPHYFPKWMLEKYPHLRKKREGFLDYCLHAPESKELLLRYIKIIIPPLKDHPSLHSICLTNEPVNVEEPCEYALRDWHIWLAQKHGDISTLNRRWGSNYSSFEEIPLPNPFSSTYDIQTPLGMDYVLFNQEWFAGWHKMLADAIHEIAPDLPVHAKAMTWTLTGTGEVDLGVDAELFSSFSQINGNDSVNFYSHGVGEFAQGWIGNLLPYDLQRSVKDIPIFNSENHIIPDREARYIPPAHIRCALWQQAVYGQSATTIWIWGRTYDLRSDSAGSIMHRPLCAEAVGIVNYDLNRLSEYVREIQRIKPQVHIIMSNSAKVWDGGHYSDCLDKLYTALTFSGVKIGFVTERQLERGEIPQTKIIFIPNMAHISDRAFEALKNFKGKIVIVGEGELLSKNEYDQKREDKLTGERLIYRYGETTWQDIWSSLRPRLRDWGIQPPIEVFDNKSRPLWGVAFLCAPTKYGTLVNLSNYRNERVELKLRTKEGSFAIDLLSNEKISLDPLPLNPLEVRLLLLKKR